MAVFHCAAAAAGLGGTQQMKHKVMNHAPPSCDRMIFGAISRPGACKSTPRLIVPLRETACEISEMSDGGLATAKPALNCEPEPE